MWSPRTLGPRATGEREEKKRPHSYIFSLCAIVLVRKCSVFLQELAWWPFVHVKTELKVTFADTWPLYNTAPPFESSLVARFNIHCVLVFNIGAYAPFVSGGYSVSRARRIAPMAEGA